MTLQAEELCSAKPVLGKSSRRPLRVCPPARAKEAVESAWARAVAETKSSPCRSRLGPYFLLLTRMMWYPSDVLARPYG